MFIFFCPAFSVFFSFFCDKICCGCIDDFGGADSKDIAGFCFFNADFSPDKAVLRAQGQAEVKLGICRKPADFFAQGSSAEAADDFIDPFIGHSLFLCGKFTGNKFCIGRERKVDLFLFCLGMPV